MSVRQHRVLVALARGEVAREPVQVDCGLHSTRDVGRVARACVLREYRCHDPGQDVAAAALGQRGVAAGVPRYAAVLGCAMIRASRQLALSTSVELVFGGETPRASPMRSASTSLIERPGEPRHLFAWMRRRGPARAV